MSIQGMVYNKITLSFSEKDEELFQKTYYSNSIFQFRVAFLLLAFLYGIFGYLDLKIIPEYVHLFHLIRFGIVIPILSLVLILSITKIFPKIWQVLLLISFIAGGSGISIMTMLVPDNYAYYAGLMLVFSAGYFFIKLRFFLASVAGWVTLLLFNIGAIFYAHTSGLVLLNHNFFFISANVIGMVAAYNIEYQARRNFFLNQKLDIENLFVEELNKNLEITIKERTKELVNAKDKAEEGDRLKSAFLANMSHEIRTPMNGILGFAELLKEPHLTLEEQQDFIQTIQISGERMLNTINNIVDVSKIESGLMKVDINETNINEKIEFTYKFFKPAIENKGLKFLFKNGLPLNEAIIKTDNEKVYGILTNLVRNAIKFTSEGSIEFGYEKKGVFLEFYVKDTGIGIPKNQREFVFDRFRQGINGINRLYEGSGLGLSICKSYVEMLGGSIWFESQEGKGSTFFFTIPYQFEEEVKTEIKDVDSSEIKKVQMKNLKILIAEDDEVSYSLLKITIQKIGKEFLHAITGVQAIEACRCNPDLDLVLMDIRMPMMDGIEATRQIRQFNKDVIIIAQTAYAFAGDSEKALEAGCNDYISKPINKTLLFELIRKHCNK